MQEFPMSVVPLAAVDLADCTFVLEGAPLDLRRLTESVREVGLLAPPFLRPTEEGRLQVVTGFKRLAVAKDLGWQEISARKLPYNFPESACLLIIVHDNAFTRGFNLAEQAQLAARLLIWWDASTVATKFLPYLGLPPAPAFLAKLGALATLEAPWLELAAVGRLSLAAGARVAAWPLPDRAAALPYLDQLRLSQSQQEEFLEQVSYLARREGVTQGAILARGELTDILADHALNPQERTEAVRRQVQRWFAPRLAAARDDFQTILGSLHLKSHPRLSLTPPPAFEGGDFRLEIRFRDADELQKLLHEIDEASQRDEFSGLTRL